MWAADPHLATALDGHFIRNYKQPQLDLVEETRVLEVLSTAIPANTFTENSLMP
jgi:hypothetical protein